jgi:hypothetical protein
MANKKKQSKRKKSAGRKAPTKKRAAKKRAPAKKAARKKKAAPKKKAARKTRVRGKSVSVETIAFEPKELGARSGGQAGDLQGLSDAAGADSESVDELLEEGNAFEAEAVKGVQDAKDADEGEVRTHEVPEDDVPGEYKDQ